MSNCSSALVAHVRAMRIEITLPFYSGGLQDVLLDHPGPSGPTRTNQNNPYLPLTGNVTTNTDPLFSSDSTAIVPSCDSTM